MGRGGAIGHAIPAALACAAALLLAPAASGAPRLLDTARGCVNPQGAIGYRSTHLAGDPFEVLGTKRTLREARRARGLIRRLRIWQRWSAAMGAPLPNELPDGSLRAGPYQVFVVSPSVLSFDDSIGGALRGYCVPAGDSQPAASVVLVASDLRKRGGGDLLPAILAHELFHAFQTGVEGQVVGGNWWHEATAVWGEHLIVPNGPRNAAEDDAFLGQPRIPLDFALPGDWGDSDRGGIMQLHEYGAWRFVQWLAQRRIHGSVWPFLRDSFRELAAGKSPVQALEDLLPGYTGQSLQDALAGFWADHLSTAPGIGPPASVPSIGSLQGPTLIWRTAAAPLAAATMRVSVPPGACVRIAGPPLGADGRLWLRVGGRYWDGRRYLGDDVVNGLLGGEICPQPGDPAEIRAVFANGGDTSAAATLSLSR